METSIEKAARLVGSQTALAKELQITPQAVQQWVASGKPPSNRCIAIEKAVSGEVTRYDLRPDVFGPSANK
jgi:DNA-binding transcriptional regulator YdaS (Cro superfamily)